MALKIIKKGDASAPQATAAAVSVAATPAAPLPTPEKPKKGQAKRLSVDGIRLDLPMRLRTGHMLSLFGSMPFRVELDNIKDIGVPVQSAAVSPVAVD